ncbi:MULTISPECIES: YciI family protein [Arthrobacter]|uniref:YciI family protein n=2 Tax=Arthrobacter TaxID=1663 RepID=A0ABU9KJA9_9MICC|nr:YciI family protein [Arthrobacter sp. YJM1]MDP5226771.1 YciI family protein [Arthrobacter sp. YJM1]
MIVVSLSYKVPLDVVEFHSPAHMEWVNDGYAKGLFVASGRKSPRTGGILLSTATLEEVQAAVERDPFNVNGVAAFDIEEFVPTRVAEGYEALLPVTE